MGVPALFASPFSRRVSAGTISPHNTLPAGLVGVHVRDSKPDGSHTAISKKASATGDASEKNSRSTNFLLSPQAFLHLSCWYASYKAKRHTGSGVKYKWSSARFYDHALSDFGRLKHCADGELLLRVDADAGESNNKSAFC